MNILEQAILSFLRTGQGEFEALALELFAYQFKKNPYYQSWCRSQGITPDSVKQWSDIPAVPIKAFKSAELASFPIGQAAAIFESSGTTHDVKSRHYLKTLSYYEASLTSSFSKAVLPDQAKLPFLVLAPSPAEAPRSSLSWMLDVVKRAYGAPGSAGCVLRGRLDELFLTQQLTQMESARQPVALLGTTIALLSFYDYAESVGKKWTLSPGSRIMDTGGMKTSKSTTTRAEFVQRSKTLLGLPEAECINEYGMCELSSQFYGRGASSKLTGPAWTRSLVIDPQTGKEAAEGQEGLLRHFDLANVDSVLAIQTEDIGKNTPNGFMLLGRDSHAEVKGCSLAAEAFLK